MAQQWSNEAHQAQITINAPAEKVFDVIANLENSAAVVTGMNNVQRKNDGTLQGTYSVNVLGIQAPLNFPIEYRVAESQKPTKIVLQADGLVKGTIQFNLMPNGNQTLVNATANYQIGVGQALDQITNKVGSAAGGLLGGLTGGVASTVGNVVNSVTSVLPLVTTANDANLNTSLTNLKVVVENMRS